MRPNWGMVRGELAAVIATWYPNERGDVDERGLTRAGRCADQIWPSIKPHVDAEVVRLQQQLAAARAECERRLRFNPNDTLAWLLLDSILTEASS